MGYTTKERCLIFEAPEVFEDIVVYERTGRTMNLIFTINDKINGSDTFDIRCTMSGQGIQHFWDTLNKNYKAIKKKLSHTKPGLIDVNALYDDLFSTGNFLREQFEGSRISELWDRIFERKSESPGTMVINSDSFTIPIEYMAKFQEDEIIYNNFIVTKYRIIKRRTDKKTHIFRNEFRHLTCICNLDLDYVCKVEHSYLMQLHSSNIITLKDYSLEFLRGNELINIITRNEFDVLHLAGHISHKDENPLNDIMTFNSNTNLAVTKIAQISNKITGKLVFINGCRSGNTKPNSSISFTNEFLKKDAATVICVDVDISDQFAAKFASKFYEELLIHKKNRRIEEILFNSAQYFLYEEKNISGFFYSVYGGTQILNYN